MHRKNMEVPPSLLDAAERKLAKLDALLDESGWVEIGFTEEQNPRIADKFHCEIVAHVKGHRLKVEGSADEPHTALDRAADKVDRQIRRLKDKRVRSRLRRTSAAGNGRAAVEEAASSTSAGLGASGPPERRTRPNIVERSVVDAKPMTPDEAIMQLGVLGDEFVLFQNTETGRAAVVYRRRDGDYGLAEMPQ